MIINIAIFGHGICKLKIVPDVAYGPSFYPHGVRVELVFALEAAGFEIQANFQNGHILA